MDDVVISDREFHGSCGSITLRTLSKRYVVRAVTCASKRALRIAFRVFSSVCCQDGTRDREWKAERVVFGCVV